MLTQLRTVLLTFAFLVLCNGQDTCINNQIRLVSAVKYVSIVSRGKRGPQCHYFVHTNRQTAPFSFAVLTLIFMFAVSIIQFFLSHAQYSM